MIDSLGESILASREARGGKIAVRVPRLVAIGLWPPETEAATPGLPKYFVRASAPKASTTEHRHGRHQLREGAAGIP